MTLHKRILGAFGIAWMFGLSIPPAAQAFELDTHAQLSRDAFDQSAVADVLHSFYGLRETDQLRGPLPWLGWATLRPVAWLVRGARDEDDLPRPANHFYDPVHNIPLSLGRLAIGARAPDWALEDGEEYPMQQYSYRDARNAFFAALTNPDRTTRERRWASAFYGLGHVIHLIQDMAQPQHTRNDWHLKWTSQRSLFEGYVDEQVTAGRFSSIGGSAPHVAIPRDLWITGTGAGLAEFSNANFVSTGTNFVESRAGATVEGFPSPTLDVADMRVAVAGETCADGTTVPANGALTFYGNGFQDPVTGQPIQNPRMTTHSIFDQHLQQRGLPLVFAYNCFNIDRAADILLPRAVSYSAALLTYFFRGSVGARDDVDSQNPNQRAFQIVNQSSDEGASGTFGLYVEPENGSLTLLASWDLTLGPGEASAPLTVSRLPDTTPPSTRCSIVFRGHLGSELDAVGGGPAPCPLELPPPRPTPWLVYYCATFDAQYNYFYATQDPPLYPEGDPVVRFYVVREGTQFSCGYMLHVYTAAPPSYARLDHPATLGG